ncbi:hypothetical protein JCM14467A_09880 [Vulcanisaeta sp. JCM 14467]
MLKPRHVVVTFFSGAKGGTGKSTLAANLAILLSQSLKTNVLLIDLGIDSSQTSSRILGIADRPGVFDYLVGSVGDLNQLVIRSSYLPSVFVVPPGNVRSYQMTVGNNEAFDRWVYLVNYLVMTTDSQLVLIDLPANNTMPVVIPPLLIAHIINVVLEYAAYSEYVLREVDNAYILPMLTRLRYRKIINIVLNKAMGQDNIGGRIREFAHNGDVFVIPMSPTAHYLTTGLRPAVLYESRGSLDHFKRALNNMANTLARQVRAVLTGRVN